MRVGDIASAIGKGLFAGAVGTAAMTISSTIEQRIRGREPSTTPVKAVEEALPIEVEEEKEEKVSNLVHWAYGTAWGAPRGILAALGLPPRVATGLHFAAVWGAALFTLPRLKATPPVREWGGKEIAIDAWHHAVYAVAAGAAFSWIDRHSRTRTRRPNDLAGRAREAVSQAA